MHLGEQREDTEARRPRAEAVGDAASNGEAVSRDLFLDTTNELLAEGERFGSITTTTLTVAFKGRNAARLAREYDKLYRRSLRRRLVELAGHVRKRDVPRELIAQRIDEARRMGVNVPRSLRAIRTPQQFMRGPRWEKLISELREDLRAKIEQMRTQGRRL